MGFTKFTDDEGECFELLCKDGTFLYLNKTARKATCEFCHPACKTCDGFKNYNCFNCQPNYFPYASNITNRLMCKGCEDLTVGYINSPKGDGSCVGNTA